MSRLLLVILLIVPNYTSIYPQYNPGAKQIALANSDVAQANDVFAVFTNPAGLSQMNWREVGLYYSPAPFGFSELANGFIAYNEPFSFGSIGIGAMIYGFDLYRESKVTLAFSYNYQNSFFVGLAADYHTVSIRNYGSTGVFYADLGGLVYLADDLRWGFDLHNLNHASFGASDDQIPVVLNTGLSIDLIDNFTLNAAVEKDIRYNAGIMFGFDYELIEYISLMSGFSNEPSRFTAGIGIHYSILNLDYAVFTHTELGITHQAGIIIDFSPGEPGKDKIRHHLGKN
jgi:hypothetical protein